ncbi:MAG: DUF4177 domain-containing protein [Paracoccus sp. (in: a-proteobacteria)]|uniref:DUF4177 domain-containing protein n=1 Tax=Paracoccus sp. TaxID=267 RepID=UPI0026DFB8D1|nr:DUF4177 domain-containing protein [Paracoccus sp. (in: a-proteobacteria)]MDO5631284.1 DUF4177 domain-containing protein [Paracoccus sp. (in: a-proteobacteria)]
MKNHEYTVIPAPERGERIKGLKTPGERYAHTLSAEINRMAADGWEYVRAETLPSEERSGLTGRQTVYLNLLVFRRALTPLTAAEPAQTKTVPQPEYPVAATAPAASEPVPVLPDAAAPQPSSHPQASGLTSSPGAAVIDRPATPPAPRESGKG